MKPPLRFNRHNKTRTVTRRQTRNWNVEFVTCAVKFFWVKKNNNNNNNKLTCVVQLITLLDTVLGAMDFLCVGGGLEYISCLFRAAISASSFSSCPVSPRRLFWGLLVGGWVTITKRTNQNAPTKINRAFTVVEWRVTNHLRVTLSLTQFTWL